MAEAEVLFTNPTVTDGNCFFHAIQQCLENYRGVGRQHLDAKLAALGLPQGTPLSVELLRFLTYSVFLVPGPATDMWISKWIMMFGVAPAEYSHAAIVAGKGVEDFTVHDRILLHSACMQATTWGDETALIVLELLLNIRVMVLTGGRLQTRPNTYGDFYPDLYIVLQLTNMHYEPVYYMESEGGLTLWAFTEAELPPVLVWLSLRDCSKAREPFINLRHLSPLHNQEEEEDEEEEDRDGDGKGLAFSVRLQYFRVLSGEWNAPPHITG
jgi:hypothetical protein